MAISKKKYRNYFVLPFCLLLLNALQEIIIYRLKFEIPDPKLFAFCVLFLSAVGFTLVGDFIAPFISKILEKGHKIGKSTAGNIGILFIILLGFVSMYALYYTIWGIEHPEYLIPQQLMPSK
jgi:hypothetical protein